MRMRTVLFIGLILVLFIITGTGIAGAVAESSTNLLPGLTSGNGIVPTLVYGNPSCDDLQCPGFELKIEKADDEDYSGTYYFDDEHLMSVVISSYSVSDDLSYNAIDWSSNVDVHCVVMKGAEGADVYCYDPPSRGDTLLTPPVNPSENPASISHIIFCDTPSVNVPEFPPGSISLILVTSGLSFLGLFLLRR